MALTDETKNHFENSRNNNIENIEILKKEVKNLTYEESISQLEIILNNIQDQNISLNKIKNNYLKGQLLLNHCEELLQFVEQEINEINPNFFEID